MLSETLIPAIAGFFATMLYNPNNVTSEVSPITTKWEIEVGKDFGTLMGYERDKCWGHITSGGTVANIEALWVARNLKYYPLAVWKALVCHWDPNVIRDIRITPDRKDKKFLELTPWQLLNLDVDEILSLRRKVIEHTLTKDPMGRRTEVEKKFDKEVKKYSIQGIGFQKFLEKLTEDPENEKTRLWGKKKKLFKKGLRDIKPGVILVPRTKHYSWDKAADVLGIGAERIIKISIDKHYRMDPEKMGEKIKECNKEKKPIIMVVSVCSSTEEGAIDDLKKINEKRKNLRKENIAFYLHSDAAYGGYFASMLLKSDSTPHITRINNVNDFKRYCNKLTEEHSELLFNGLCFLKDTDSATIDPHKLGYIPYPAGGIVFKNKAVQDMISFEAPYIFHGNEEEFIGRYILEGSKPGAAATAVYLSHRVIGLNQEGYGDLLYKTIRAARIIYMVIKKINDDLQREERLIKVIPISEPDTNIIDFVVNFKDNVSLKKMNELAEILYNELGMIAGKELHEYHFIISKTDFEWDGYHGNTCRSLLTSAEINPGNFVSETPIEEKDKDDKITVFRITLMNPWLLQGKVNYFKKFGNYLGFLLRLLSPKILIVEDENKDAERLINILRDIEAVKPVKFASWGRAKTREEAIKWLRKNVDIDILLLDVELVYKDDKALDPIGGMGVLSYLRKEMGKKHTPVIVYSKFPESEKIEKLVEHRFDRKTDYFIHKEREKSEEERMQEEHFLLVKILKGLRKKYYE